MSNTGKQSPLGVNVLGSILQNTGFNINPVAASYMGASRVNAEYTFGNIVQQTCLRLLTWSINDGFGRGVSRSGIDKTLTDETYDALISIGLSTIPSLGNAKPPTYLIVDPSEQWTVNGGPATTGYYLSGNVGQGQAASWIPYLTPNPNNSVTQWGFVRCWALQAWNEFNWNGIPTSPVNYQDFTSSFLTCQGYADYTNIAINSTNQASTFLDGVYSNMNDLITGEVAGVSLALPTFGQDCIAAGKTIDLSKISSFGLPSTLLQTLRKYSALTPSVSLALLSAGLSNLDIDIISMGINTATSAQERLIYGGFTVIVGEDLLDVLVPLNCKTPGLTNLADLLNIKKLFPISYPSLTVPVYNASPGPSNSKTYYPIFDASGGVSSQIDNITINTMIGTIFPSGVPSVAATTTETTQVLSEGFGSYLDQILPRSIAWSSGAFAFSMQQLKNVQNMNFEKFAQITTSLELTTGLPKVNGTTVPSYKPLASQGNTILALGSGPDNTFTMSDFFGCMSGLPYLWNDIKTGINAAETQKLYNIYHEQFLAVTWEKAKLSISQPYWYTVTVPYVAPTYAANPPNPNYQPIDDPTAIPPLPPYDPIPYINGATGAPTYCPTYWATSGSQEQYDWWYNISITLVDDGGGYGRGTAPDPTVTILPNNVGEAYYKVTVGRDDNDAASMGGGTFGRVAPAASYNGDNFKWTSTVQDNWENIVGYDTDAAAQTPPIYPPKDLVWVQANIPIETVQIQHAPVATLPVSAGGAFATDGTNTEGDVWADPVLCPPNGLISLGEQGWPGMDDTVNSYTIQANQEIISIQQTKVTISKNLNVAYDAAGAQLTREQRARYIALLPVPSPTREERLNPYPITLLGFTDALPSLAQNTDPHMYAQTIEAIADYNTVGGQSTVAMARESRNQTRLQLTGGDLDNNIPGGLEPTLAKTLISNGTVPSTAPATPPANINGFTQPGVLVVVNPAGSGVTVPTGLVSPSPGGYYNPNTGVYTTTSESTKVNQESPIINILNTPTDNVVITAGARLPAGTGTPLDTGQGYPGSLSGSEYSDLVPNSLKWPFNSATLTPGYYTVDQAIAEVIKCNCNCWIA